MRRHQDRIEGWRDLTPTDGPTVPRDPRPTIDVGTDQGTITLFERAQPRAHWITIDADHAVTVGERQ
jgi:hypothetical protein